MKTVIEMAETLSHGWWLDDEKLERFAELVRADEREACAKIANGGADGEDPFCCVPIAHSIADKIRARSNT